MHKCSYIHALSTLPLFASQSVAGFSELTVRVWPAFHQLSLIHALSAYNVLCVMQCCSFVNSNQSNLQSRVGS